MVSEVGRALHRLNSYVRAIDEYDANGQKGDPPVWTDGYSSNPDPSSFRSLDCRLWDDIRVILDFLNRPPRS